MYLTSEQKRIGQRNFWAVVGPDLNPDRLKLETCIPRGFPGGPVRGGIVGVGGQGSVLLNACRPEFIDLVAVCDINPAHQTRACNYLASQGWKQPTQYTDWREMAHKENLEVVIIATPLWSHAEIASGFLEAGTNVLCEKMMAHDVAGCRQMIAAADKAHRKLEIGYPRFYDFFHQAMEQSFFRPRRLGDIHFVRMFTDRNESWRRYQPPPFPGFDPRPWGYPDWEHLNNWRMYDVYSRGMMAELASHLTSCADWLLGADPTSVYASGGIYYYKDGRQVDDHMFVTYQYPGGCNLELVMILTNDFEGLYEEFNGTEGTLILSETAGPLYFPKDPNSIHKGKDNGLTLDFWTNFEIAFRTELWTLCSAARHGTPLLCGTARGLSTTVHCLAGQEAARTQSRVEISAT